MLPKLSRLVLSTVLHDFTLLNGTDNFFGGLKIAKMIFFGITDGSVHAGQRYMSGTCYIFVSRAKIKNLSPEQMPFAEYICMFTKCSPQSKTLVLHSALAVLIMCINSLCLNLHSFEYFGYFLCPYDT